MSGAWLRRIGDSDLFFSFRTNPVAIGAALVALVMILGAVFAPWIAPHQPFDLASLNLSDSLMPPAWTEQGRLTYALGTDDQGRDVLSTILYGSRISLLVGLSSVVLSMTLGVGLGLLSGYLGGRLDATNVIDESLQGIDAIRADNGRDVAYSRVAGLVERARQALTPVLTRNAGFTAVLSTIPYLAFAAVLGIGAILLARGDASPK